MQMWNQYKIKSDFNCSRARLHAALYQLNPRTDELILEIFQGAPVESGLLEAIVLSVVLLRSGRSLGDSPGDLIGFSFSNPMYFSQFTTTIRMK